MSTQQAKAFLDQYFHAINSHDYHAYIALLAPGEPAPSPSQFHREYGSTTDTGENLSGTSTGADGEVVAHVTFTSHQDPSQSPTGTSCDTWDVSLYLVADSGSYQIGKPPPGYRAGYKACS
ncbi:MAG TPA: nuclear transport factor 2 family protein [Trebonia sp.]